MLDSNQSWEQGWRNPPIYLNNWTSGCLISHLRIPSGLRTWSLILGLKPTHPLIHSACRLPQVFVLNPVKRTKTKPELVPPRLTPDACPDPGKPWEHLTALPLPDAREFRLAAHGLDPGNGFVGFAAAQERVEGGFVPDWSAPVPFSLPLGPDDPVLGPFLAGGRW